MLSSARCPLHHAIRLDESREDATCRSGNQHEGTGQSERAHGEGRQVNRSWAIRTAGARGRELGVRRLQLEDDEVRRNAVRT